MSLIKLDGKKVLDEHIECFGGILLHVLSAALVHEKLIELLKNENSDKKLIEIYIVLIQLMWEMGDEKIVNVVNVSILERLFDNEEVWNRFWNLISSEFKNYIDEVALRKQGSLIIYL